VLADAYEIARIRASAETGLKEELFPENSPYSLEEVLEETFFPQQGYPPGTESGMCLTASPIIAIALETTNTWNGC